MKSKLSEISRRYLTALQSYVKNGSASDLEPAREIGQLAIALGLETLDLARIHEIALVAIVLPSYSSSTNDGLMGQAGIFFAEALMPIEETHRGVREANKHLNVSNQKLNQRTSELANSIKDLESEIEQRQAVEDCLRISERTASNLLEKSQAMEAELRHLSRQLLLVQEDERKRISRELHDVIAQTLTSIKLQLDALKKDPSAGSLDLQTKITKTQLLVEASVGIVHRFARELRPSLLDDLGLIPALQSYLKSFIEATGIQVTIMAFAEIEQSDNDIRTVFYRIAQEALTNVSRHAKASHAEVTIRKVEGRLCMDIKDNGQGFDWSDATPANSIGMRLGMLGMRERSEMVGGSFHVNSELGIGTTVYVEIPTNMGAER